MARRSRDAFRALTKRILAARVAHRCCNPDCGALTSGPQTRHAKAVSIGVAAHITAASPGGARYAHELTFDKRSDFANGIWLCQNCAKLVDNDPLRFTA